MICNSPIFQLNLLRKKMYAEIFKNDTHNFHRLQFSKNNNLSNLSRNTSRISVIKYFSLTLLFIFIINILNTTLKILEIMHLNSL